MNLPKDTEMQVTDFSRVKDNIYKITDGVALAASHC